MREEIEAAAARHGLRIASALPSHSDGEWEILIGPIAVYLDMDTGAAFPMRRATGIGIVPRRLPSLDEALAAVRRDLEECAAALVTPDPQPLTETRVDSKTGDTYEVLAHYDQPAPTRGTGDVWSEVIDDARNRGVAPELVDLMIARRQLGIGRYGTPLQRDNGRDHRRDLREELLDATAYAWAAGEHGVASELVRMLEGLV